MVKCQRCGGGHGVQMLCFGDIVDTDWVTYTGAYYLCEKCREELKDKFMRVDDEIKNIGTR